jgi:hypothetical protein
MKVDIVIKSFNRPYYLDRCLFSINKFLKNHDGNIIVIDDGTPIKYLNKIQKLFPKVSIVQTEFYNKKNFEIVINSGKQIPEIPINSWIETIKKVSDYFLLLEDDIWFTQTLDFNKLADFIQNKNVAMVKMNWLSNESIINAQTLNSNNFFLEYKPKVITENPFFYKLIFNSHRFGISKIFKLLKLNTTQNILPYYSIYSVAGVLFSKDYFLNLWNGHTNKVNEQLQIINALKYYQNHNSVFIRTQKEIVSTGFMSSATNFYKKSSKTDFDMMKFNAVLNLHWYEESFNVYDDLENDLSENAISAILISENNPKIKLENWKKWVEDFKNLYINLGCKIN